MSDITNSYVYEFEIYPSNGVFYLEPFDFEGFCFGFTFEQACRICGRYLQDLVDANFSWIGGVPPVPTFDNKPKHEGGKTVIVAAGSELPLVLDWEKAQSHFEELVEGADFGRNTAVIFKDGEPAAKLIPIPHEELEDEEDYDDEEDEE